MNSNKPLIETWAKLVSENENNLLVYSIQKIKEDQDGNVIREFKPTLYDMELTNNMSLRDSIEDLVSGFSTEFDEEDTVGIRDFVQDASGEISWVASNTTKRGFDKYILKIVDFDQKELLKILKGY